MNKLPRVALFADTFHETNGAANVLRRLTAYAKSLDIPFLCIRSGKSTRVWNEGSLEILELKTSPLSIKLDTELKYDPWLWRHKPLVGRVLNEFQPDILHLTGYSDISQLGFYFAHFKDIPAVASWHTNGHEYAARRALNKLNWLPPYVRGKLGNTIEKTVLHATMKMLFLAQVQLAPNEEIVQQLRQMTERPSFLMSRGVDTDFLSPQKRNRGEDDKVFTIGYVGRLQAEKNVRFLAEIEENLQKAGLTDYRFLVIGDGGEKNWLQANLRQAEFTGALLGEDLAKAYANMDLFVFPSKTDAFGNVVLEAMAAGVPCVVMTEGGPKFLIEDGESGFVARDEHEFCGIVKLAITDPERLSQMRIAARQAALQRSWESVFEGVFEKYQYATTLPKNVRVGEDNRIISLAN